MAQAVNSSAVLSGNEAFARELYKILSTSSKDENIIFSPLSVHTVLCMLYQGSSGSTLEALKAVLNVPGVDETANSYEEVVDDFKSVQNAELLIANKIFVMEGHNLKDEFLNTMLKRFKSGVEAIDFEQSESAAEKVNIWVSDNTKNRIQNLLSPSVLDEYTRLVLINALYFKCNWAHRFNESATKVEEYHVSKNEKIKVEMMHAKEKFNFRYDAELNVKILELPYENNELSMVILLPENVNGIIELERKIQEKDLSYVLSDTNRVKVAVSVPKFKIEASIDLVDSLKAIGLEEIFDEDRANLDNMIEDPSDEPNRLFVSQVKQKVFMEVNEEGCEAAAATAAVVRMKRSLLVGPEHEEFIADHPFIFYLLKKVRDAEVPSILFMGKIVRPNEVSLKDEL